MYTRLFILGFFQIFFIKYAFLKNRNISQESKYFIFRKEKMDQTENAMQDLIPKMTDMVVTEVDEKQKQRLESFLNLKKQIGEPRSSPDFEYEKIAELGAGNGGVVHCVKHKKTGIHMARKLIHMDVKQAVLKQIVTELRILHECRSPYIVGYFGAYQW